MGNPGGSGPVAPEILALSASTMFNIVTDTHIDTRVDISSCVDTATDTDTNTDGGFRCPLHLDTTLRLPLTLSKVPPILSKLCCQCTCQW